MASLGAFVWKALGMVFMHKLFLVSISQPSKVGTPFDTSHTLTR